MKHAFRCDSCGRLHTSDDAAESDHPHACKVCGAGTEFDRRGLKLFRADNWEVLADATPERLSEIGLSADDVEKHVAWQRHGRRSDHVPKDIHVRVEDHSSSRDGA